ncbi:MAG: ATP-binding protein [Terriglobia bacterium]
MSTVLDKGTIPFQVEGRLIQELGLRLVASPEVALVELIKNSYDADSPICTVRLEDGGKKLVIADEGHGMTYADFAAKWMRIATSSKLAQQVSPKYHRRLTGAKGIGRFAVRYLGDRLILETVAFDRLRKCVTKLKATFTWAQLDVAQDIVTTKVPFEVVWLPDGTPTGTTLIIQELRNSADFTRSTDLRNNVLRIVSPLQGLESGKFASINTTQGQDPGFQVVLPGETESEEVDLAKLVLDNYWARLTVQLDANDLRFRVWFSGAKKPKELDLLVKTDISNGFFADIRHFPRRKGVFQDKGVNGQKAWQWVRENCGIKMVDHGFHIKPYGFPKDDWLQLDVDKARNKRDWETEIANDSFPVTSIEKAEPKHNPVLNQPYNFQVVGAVFIETHRGLGSEDKVDLVPAMDREGLIGNQAFEQLRNFIKAGIEFLAHEDKAELDRLAGEAAKEAARTAREDIRKAIEYIQKSPTLVASDKARIVKQYRVLADRVEEQEEYSAESRRSLLTMSMLGVVAGFMTHESKAILFDLEQAVGKISDLAKKDPKLGEIANDLSERLEKFKGYLDYSRSFVKNVRGEKDQPLSAAGQVRHILNLFGSFADDRGIKVTNEIPPDLKTPPLPVTGYSGVLLNLYTNALKAVIAAQSSIRAPHISFRGWNEKGRHIVEVADNGVGIPPEVQSRIWEPLYTTTSDMGNPLGSGMGLGLPLIRQVVSELGGKISLVPNPPPKFTTCFRVEFSNR